MAFEHRIIIIQIQKHSLSMQKSNKVSVSQYKTLQPTFIYSILLFKMKPEKNSMMAELRLIHFDITGFSCIHNTLKFKLPLEIAQSSLVICCLFILLNML